MNRRQFLKYIPATSLPLMASGCGLWGAWRIDPMHYMVRSDRFDSPEQEQKIVSKARLTWSDDGRVRVIYLRGTPYERGYQHGALLRNEVQENLNFIYQKALRKFHYEELFAEIYERMRPYIPQDYIEEMHGLAHGSRMPLHVIHHMHILPSLGEWGGKKKIGKTIKAMMRGDFGTSCSNLTVSDSATEDGSMYTVRILDWGLHRISKLHEFPLLMVSVPETGYASVAVTWVGFIGAVSGMNQEGITLGEAGYGNPPNETLYGEPMPFLLREVLRNSKDLADVRRVISSAPPTASFVYLMSDGKTRESEMYVRDPDRFLVFHPNQYIEDGDETLPPIKDILYGGHYNEKMAKILADNYGHITLSMLQKEIIPEIIMKSNFHNVIYDPIHLKLWVNNARDKFGVAATEPYTEFNLKSGLESFLK